MSTGRINKARRWMVAAVAVAVLASVTLAAGGIQIVSATPVSNTAVIVLMNSGSQPVTGTLVVEAVTSNGMAVQSAASFSVGAGSLASVVVAFDTPIGSIGGIQCGMTTDSPTPF